MTLLKQRLRRSWRNEIQRNPKGKDVGMDNKSEHRGGSGNFAEDRERASQAGRKGGKVSGGNFKNDPARASAAGKKGGEQSAGVRSRSR
jgi:general stress protein YciG